MKIIILVLLLSGCGTNNPPLDIRPSCDASLNCIIDDDFEVRINLIIPEELL